MPQAPDYDKLLSTLTLGTARREVAPSVTEWLAERNATDPTADGSEQLLAAWAISERVHRLRPVQPPEAIAMSPAPSEVLPYATPRLARGLQLIFRGTYPDVLPEALSLLAERALIIPPHLLPDLLDKASSVLDGNPLLAARLFSAGGQRAGWLAAFHPGWAELLPDYNFAKAFTHEATPGRRQTLLKRWRRASPDAAREALASIWAKQSPKNQETLLATIEVSLSANDLPWLRGSLAPKRKGVRRELLRILLLAGEEQATDEMIALAASALNDEGKLPAIHPDKTAKQTINDYGGLKAKESLPEFLLSQLPPTAIPDLLGLPPAEYWATLPKQQLKAAALAVLAFDQPIVSADFTRFALIVNPAQLPIEEAAKIVAGLPQDAFVEVFHDLLDREKNVLHYGGAARVFALSRNEPWSDRISKAFVLQLVATLRDIRDLPYGLQRDLQSHWKLSIPLLDASIFQWMRTHLHSMTERSDAFGKLATEMLQTMSFREAIRK